jgi:hypothetical protein
MMMIEEGGQLGWDYMSLEGIPHIYYVCITNKRTDIIDLDIILTNIYCKRRFLSVKNARAYDGIIGVFYE